MRAVLSDHIASPRQGSSLLKQHSTTLRPPVPLPLLVTEVDRAARSLAAVGDLVVMFRDRRGDAALAQPRPVRPGRVALVRQQPVRALTWPSGRAGHADLVERFGQHGRVRDLATGQDERQRPSHAVGDQVRLGRQPATGAADRVISGFVSELLEVRPCPRCPWAGSRRAGGHARSWSRSTRSSRRRRPGEPSRGPARGRAPRPRPSTSGRSSCRSCSSSRTAPGRSRHGAPVRNRHAVASTTMRRSTGGRPVAFTAGHSGTQRDTAARARPTPHQRSRHATQPQGCARRLRRPSSNMLRG